LAGATSVIRGVTAGLPAKQVRSIPLCQNRGVVAETGHPSVLTGLAKFAILFAIIWGVNSPPAAERTIPLETFRNRAQGGREAFWASGSTTGRSRTGEAPLSCPRCYPIAGRSERGSEKHNRAGPMTPPVAWAVFRFRSEDSFRLVFPKLFIFKMIRRSTHDPPRKSARSTDCI